MAFRPANGEMFFGKGFLSTRAEGDCCVGSVVDRDRTGEGTKGAAVTTGGVESRFSCGFAQD